MTPDEHSNKLTAMADQLELMHLQLRDLSLDIPGLPKELVSKDDIIRVMEERYAELLSLSFHLGASCCCESYTDCSIARMRGVSCRLEKI